MSGIIRWEDPPPIARPGTAFNYRLADWARIAVELSEAPGKWAFILRCRTATSARMTAENIRNGGTMSSLGPVEAVARTVDGEFRVYARYVDEDGAP